MPAGDGEGGRRQADVGHADVLASRVAGPTGRMNWFG